MIVYLEGIFCASRILKSTRQPAISFYSWMVFFCKAACIGYLICNICARGNKTSFTNQLSLSSWSAPPVIRFPYSPPYTHTWIIAEQIAKSIWLVVELDRFYCDFLSVFVIISLTNWRIFARFTVRRMTASALAWMQLSGELNSNTTVYRSSWVIKSTTSELGYWSGAWFETNWILARV